jgi:hypothetical protein
MRWRAGGNGTLVRWLGSSLLALTACGEIHVDPADAGPDHAAQGEYSGSGWGAQLIALGDGAFEAVFLPGGLPGAGWNGKERVALEGQRVAEAVRFQGAFAATLEQGVLRAQREGGEVLELRKLERRSPTLGAAAPPGAIVLFDGTGLGELDGEQTRAGDLAAGATSRRSFAAFELHLEFRTPFMPSYRGQRRGNSGVYLQNRYEIQVLDTFGRPAEIDGCGALYGQKPPDLNMSFPPLAWQTYDVGFEPARFDAQGRRTRAASVTLRHNGVLVHDRISLAGSMDGGDPEGPEPGPLHLQDLWIPVSYRNVWIRPLEAP